MHGKLLYGYQESVEVKTKCLLSVVLFVASLTVLFPSSSVSASTTDICSGNPPAVNYDEAFHAWSPSAFGDTFFTDNYDSSTDGLLLFKDGNTAQNYVYSIMWIKNGNITALKNGTDDYRFVGNGSAYLENFYLMNFTTDNTSSGTGGSTKRLVGYQVECVYGYQGHFVYDTSWDMGEIIGEIQPPEEPGEPTCDPFDVICWFGSFVGTIVDGFQGLADLFTGLISTIAEFIANIIMPKNEDGEFENRFMTLFDDTYNSMRNKLGFLTFPFDFIANLLGRFGQAFVGAGNVDSCVANGSSGYPAYCDISVPNLLGDHDVAINIGALEKSSPTIWAISTVLLQLVWIVGIVGLLHQKYFSVVKE